MDAQDVATARSANRSLLFIGVGVVALTIVTVIVVLLTGSRQAETFGAESPEGTLQRYLAAFDDGDLESAHAYFSADIREQMDLDAYERAVDSYGMYAEDVARSVYFDATSGEGDRVVLQLTIEEFYGGGMNGSSYRSQREIRMVREAGQWRIDEPLVWLDPAPIEPHF